MLLLSPRSGSAREGREAPGKPPGRSVGQLHEKQLLQKQEGTLGFSSASLQRALSGTGGRIYSFTLSFGRGTKTYGSRQESERIRPHEHASPLD